MVNSVANQTIDDGAKNLVVKVDVVGDGSGEVSAVVIIDISTYTANTYGVSPTACNIKTITANLSNFDAVLLWDANTPLQALTLTGGSSLTDCRSYGGLKNNASTGITGDIKLTTLGLGSGDRGTIILELEKQY